ncbi:hypothetical protein C8R47DRAFT_790415 [Mycena vitilis]|nr:hypothetical protein C8R47DRAFT_790415 [Mycena vitilis]
MSWTRPSCLPRRLFREVYCCRRISSSLWRASELELSQQKQKARLQSAVNWVHRVLKPSRPDVPLPVTVWVHHVPPDTPLDELLRLVLFGPLFRITDKLDGQTRFISLTFFENATAVAFYREMTENVVILRGARLKFEWGRRTSAIQGEVPGNTVGSRTIFIHDVRRLGSRKKFDARIARYGPIDRVHLNTYDNGAFVDFMSAKSAIAAAKSLRGDRIRYGFADDRCYAAGRLRSAAMQNRVRQVILNDIPPGTSLAELCDHVRGGGLERILFIPERRVAFVHFLAHSAAAAFSRHALYYGVTIRGQRLGAKMKADTLKLARLVPHIDARVASGATRCLRIKGAPPLSENEMRRDFERFGRVERVDLAPPTGCGVVVSFADIEHAMTAAWRIGHQPGYEDAEVEFAPDRCAGPLPNGAQNTAQALQAHIANFLTLQAR